MATHSHLSESKRKRGKYWNGGFPLPVAKRTISGALAYDSDLMSMLHKIDDMDNNDNYAEGTDAINKLDGEIGFSAVLKSIITKAEIGLKAQAHNDGESTDEKGCNDQMGEELRERNSEATSSVCDIKGFKDFDDVGAEIGILEDHIRPHEFGIIINYIEVYSVANTMDYSDTGYGYAKTTKDFYGFLWDTDIWQFNEHLVIQNDFDSPQQHLFGISGAEFHDV